METLYRKKANGRYEETSIAYTDDLSDGVWLVQSKPHSRSITSLFWKVGDLKRVADVTTHAALLGFQDQLTTYLSKLTDETSPEYKDAKERFYMHGPVQLGNISTSDLCSLFLRQIAINIENTNEQTR